MPHATSSGLDWPFRSRKRLEKKLAASAVREVTSYALLPVLPYRLVSAQPIEEMGTASHCFAQRACQPPSPVCPLFEIVDIAVFRLT